MIVDMFIWQFVQCAIIFVLCILSPYYIHLWRAKGKLCFTMTPSLECKRERCVLQWHRICPILKKKTIIVLKKNDSSTKYYQGYNDSNLGIFLGAKSLWSYYRQPNRKKYFLAYHMAIKCYFHFLTNKFETLWIQKQ